MANMKKREKREKKKQLTPGRLLKSRRNSLWWSSYARKYSKVKKKEMNGEIPCEISL